MKKNGKLVTALLLLLISISFQHGHARDSELTQEQRVAIGLMHSLKNEKKEAWDILFPEAKAGNVDAMFHLGQMMVRSPEYKDNLARAKTFFEAAARKGHKGASAMLLNVQKQLSLRAGDTIPSIGGKSALPTPEDRAKAAQFLSQQKEMVGRFVSSAIGNDAEVSIDVYISNEIPFADRVADLEPAIKSRYPEKVKFTYHVVVDQRTWKPSTSFRSNGEPNNMIGFQPDMNGRSAISKGVRKTPAIVIEKAGSQRRIVSSPEQINSELAGILK